MVVYRLHGCGSAKGGIHLATARGDKVFPVSESTWKSVVASRKTSPVMSNGTVFGDSPLLDDSVATMRAQHSVRSG